MPADRSNDELAAAVDAHNKMARLENARTPKSKRRAYKDLSWRFGRTKQGCREGMKNISSVFSEMRRLRVLARRQAQIQLVAQRPMHACVIFRVSAQAARSVSETRIARRI